MTDQIAMCLADPGQLESVREKICYEIVMDVDGGAADRVADAIVAADQL